MNPTINFLIYSLPGVGKTMFGALTPDLFILDTEGSSRNLSGMEDRRKEVKSLNDVRDVLKQIENNTFKFKSLMIDTLDILVEDQMKEELRQKGFSREEGIITLEGYNVMKNKLMSLVRSCRKAGVNILFTAHAENEDVPGEGRMWRCKFPSKWSKEVLAEMDCVGFLKLEKNKDGSTIRRLHLRPSIMFDAKARGDIDTKLMKAVDIFPQYLDDATFGQVLKIYEDHYASLTKPVEGKK